MTTNQDQDNESSEIEIINATLGIDYEKMKDEITKINLLTWEQVLLLAIYARKLCFDKNSSHFLSRIQFVEVLLSQGRAKEEYPESLICLDAGESTTSIINKLSKEDSKSCLRTRSILRDIDEKQIAFSKLHEPLEYSHISLYYILRCPIIIFQGLLTLKPPKELLDYAILQNLDKLRKRNIRSFTSLQEDKNHFQDIAESINDLSNKNIAIDPKAFISNLQNDIEGETSLWMHNVFNLLLHPYLRPKNTSNVSLNLYENICTIFPAGENIQLNIDKAALAQLTHLGELDQFMLHIRNSLASKIDKNYISKYEASLLRPSYRISNWFQHSKTGIIKRDDQIPKIIAGIIDFDIQISAYKISFFHYLSGFFQAPISKTTSRSITTNIIKHCLYYSNTFNEVEDEANCHITYNDSVNELFSNLSNPNKFNNSLMSVWADSNEAKLKNRIKGSRELFLNHIGSIDEHIKNQKRSAIDNEYPVNSPYPLPLWSSRQ
jgi:hypothetical protein